MLAWAYALLFSFEGNEKVGVYDAIIPRSFPTNLKSRHRSNISVSGPLAPTIPPSK